MGQFAATHVVKFTLVGTLFSQETINTFYYGTTDAMQPIADLIAGFIDQVVPPIQTVCSNAWGVLHCDGESVLGNNDFGSQLIEQSGAISGDCLPTFVSWDFTLLRGGVGERNGYKRFAGVPESGQTNGIATGGSLVNLADLGTAIGDDLAVGGSIYTPGILRKTIHHVHQTEVKLFTISTVIYSKIGSQNSRKVGHGR